MSSFDKREQAFENKFFHDEEMKFKTVARRRKLLGLWAAHQLHKSEEESLEFALEIVRFGIENPKDGAVAKEIQKQLKKGGIELSLEEIELKIKELHIAAEKSLLEEYNAG